MGTSVLTGTSSVSISQLLSTDFLHVGFVCVGARDGAARQLRGDVLTVGGDAAVEKEDGARTPTDPAAVIATQERTAAKR